MTPHQRVAALARFNPDTVVLAGGAWAIVTPTVTVTIGEPDDVVPVVIVPFAALKVVVGKGDETPVTVGDETLTHGAKTVHVDIDPATWPDLTLTYTRELSSIDAKASCGVAAFAGAPRMKHRPSPMYQVVRYTEDGIVWATDRHRMVWYDLQRPMPSLAASPKVVAGLGRCLPSKDTPVTVGDNGVFAWDDIKVALHPVGTKPLDRTEQLTGPDWSFTAPDLSAIAGMDTPVTITPKVGKVLVASSNGSSATLVAPYEGDAAPFGINPEYLATVVKWCPPERVGVTRRAVWWQQGPRGAAVALVKLPD